MNLISNFSVNKKEYKLDISGKISNSSDIVIIEREDNIILNTKWRNKGYVNLKLLEKSTQRFLQNNIINHLIYTINNLFKSVNIKKSDFINYHKIISNKQHYDLLSNLKDGISFEEINFDKKILEKAVSNELGIEVSTQNKNSDEINPNIFYFRIVRPKQNDFNPPHKDIYLNRLKNGVNFYMPILGSNEFSSLPLFPGSHLFNEKDIIKTENGCIINNKKFTVPAVLKTTHGLDLIRPNPSIDEIMLFSPYLIHGGGTNENPDTTRVSMELRFWRV